MAIRLVQITTTATLLLVSLLVCGVSDAVAQSQWKTLTDRAYININGAFQGASDTAFTETLTDTLYGEAATYELKNGLSIGGSTFDVGFGARVWNNVAAGLSISSVTTSSSLSATGTVPHPLFYNRSRNVTYQDSDLSQSNLAYHVQFSWFVPLSDDFDVAIFAGPSFFTIDHRRGTLPVSIENSGTLLNNAVMTKLATQTSSGTATGVNAGIDATYHLMEFMGAGVGAGVMVRWSSGSVDLATASGTQSVDAGGVQIAVGARLRF